MNIEQRLIEPFSKAKYLSEQNYRRYNSIVHFLYVQHEVYYAPPALPTTILEHIEKNDTFQLFEDYDIVKLETDLKQLEEWGNVFAHTDTSHVSKIEDFNKRKLRYQLTPETVEIERLMQRLSSQVSLVKGKLDAKNIKSLAGLILSLEKFKNVEWTSENRDMFQEIWDEIFLKFDSLRQDSSDYLGIINSKNLDEALQNKNILTFRTRFNDYLTSFVMALIQNMNIIGASIEETTRILERTFIPQLVKSQLEKPTLGDELTEEQYAEIFINQWIGMKKWFVRDSSGERYIDYLYMQTNETISRFLKYVQQISERDQMIQNRTKDMEHIAKLFKNETDFAKMQQCFGAMTNVERPLHFYSPNERKIEANVSLLDHVPEILPLKDAKIILARERKQLATIQISEEDLREITLLEAQKEAQEKEILDLIQMGSVKIQEMKDVKPFVRQTLLGWISNCNGRDEMTGKTEHGITYSILKLSDAWVRLQCTDGSLEMPDYQIVFEVNA